MSIDVAMVVYEGGEDVSVRTVVDGRGFVHVLSEANGKMVSLPKLTADEARKLAEMLIESAGASDTK